MIFDDLRAKQMEKIWQTRLSNFYYTSLQSDIMALSFTHKTPSIPEYYPAVPIYQGINERNAKYHKVKRIPFNRHVNHPLPNMTNENVPQLTDIIIKFQSNLTDKKPMTDDALTSIYTQQALITGVKPTFKYAFNKSLLHRKVMGKPIGIQTHLQGPLMYEFMNKLTTLVLPKWKNWYGFNKKGNHQGDFECLLPNQVIGSFPELEYAYDAIPAIESQKFYPFTVLFKTSAFTDWQMRTVLSGLGLPFIDEDGVKEVKKLKLQHEKPTGSKYKRRSK
eukprot:NODE_679_length_4801_cov_0.851978.p1 type:complete len:277 gc:universal NODE_679_length_4801_cov_0.851978:951-121(-)